MIRFYLEPRTVITWEDFINSKPNFSIALDGYVKGLLSRALMPISIIMKASPALPHAAPARRYIFIFALDCWIPSRKRGSRMQGFT
jgi:hypothetical protein